MGKHENTNFSIIRFIISISAYAILIVVLALFFTRCCGVIYVAVGSSMKDTIENQDVLLINELSFKLGDPGRYDLILFSKANGYEGVKRIVGLPGEHVSIKSGNIYIDGERLEQSYWTDVYAMGDEECSMRLGKDEYFVLGDNLSFSEDSRSAEIGAVLFSEIQGKPWFCCYPFTDFGRVN